MPQRQRRRSDCGEEEPDRAAMAAAVKTPALGLGNRLFHLRPSFGDRGIFSPTNRAVKASPEITAAHTVAALVAGGILMAVHALAGSVIAYQWLTAEPGSALAQMPAHSRHHR